MIHVNTVWRNHHLPAATAAMDTLSVNLPLSPQSRPSNGPVTRYFGMTTSYKRLSIASAVNGRDVHIFSEPGSISTARQSAGVTI